MSPHPLERAVVMVLDSCGAGEAPDADRYGDSGSDTLWQRGPGGRRGWRCRISARRVLGCLHPGLEGVPGSITPRDGVRANGPVGGGKGLHHRALGDRRTFGHPPVRVLFPGGFPPTLTGPIEAEFGRKFLGERPPPRAPSSSTGWVMSTWPPAGRSSTHQPTRCSKSPATPTCWISPSCIGCARFARRHCDEHRIGGSLPGLSLGNRGNFRRTYDRKDFSMLPPAPTLLDRVRKPVMTVWGIGKTEDLFCGRGITRSEHTEGDADGLDKTVTALSAMRSQETAGLIFTNLVDLDMRLRSPPGPPGLCGCAGENRLPGSVGVRGPGRK